MGTLASNGHVIKNITMKKIKDGVVSADDMQLLFGRDNEFDHMKILRFMKVGYKPHFYQQLFHSTRKSTIVFDAGRRTGKTVAAAFEAAYMAHPQWGRDILVERGVDFSLSDMNDNPIIGCIVVRNAKAGQVTHRNFRAALNKVIGKGNYEWNKTDGVIGIPTIDDPLSLVYLRTATDPDSLRGDGYHWGWWDEAAFVDDPDAWFLTFSPTLGEYNGFCMFTTTPNHDEGKWWLFDEFIAPCLGAIDRDGKKTSGDPDIEYVHCYSIESPYFSLKFWDKIQQRVKDGRMHPLIFKREYLAQWERAGGNLLKDKYLRFFEYDQMHLLEEFRDKKCDHLPLELILDKSKYFFYMGMDPAATVKQTSDYTVCKVLAVDKVSGFGYFVDGFRERLEPIDQPGAAYNLALKWGVTTIGVETNAYQVALKQYIEKIAHEIQVTPIVSKGKKEDRILNSSTMFNSGKVFIHKSHANFLKEWVEFPYGDHDDELDACEITFRTAPGFYGTIEETPVHEEWDRAKWESKQMSLLLQQENRILNSADSSGSYDQTLGSEF